MPGHGDRRALHADHAPDQLRHHGPGQQGRDRVQQPADGDPGGGGAARHSHPRHRDPVQLLLLRRGRGVRRADAHDQQEARGVGEPARQLLHRDGGVQGQQLHVEVRGR